MCIHLDKGIKGIAVTSCSWNILINSMVLKGMSSTFTRGNVCYRSWFWSLLGQTKSVCAAFTHCLWQALKCTSSRYSKCFAYGWKMNKKKNLTEQYTLTLFEELQQMKFAKLRCCSYMQCKKFDVDYLFDNELFWWIVGKKRCSSIQICISSHIFMVVLRFDHLLLTVETMTWFFH